ncbi:DUF2591 family protein [Citrobacter freundii]|uniref:DUF2591 family protein n=1 Tax=Citrobacter freundii TaxID=546 RepID=A0AAN4EYE3_CITFR|nr:phage protein NinX family protein [Citrobacter freundii]EKW2111729.1 DUF2591 family protein [Citrobacter freundii]QLX64629.1 DUF2591 family protein [Citrobacter freundii]HAT2187661.1 DUF2591 domain-containing protein [Citrobacter freundii]HAT2231247.1 DUF2591 domain-containing protein [Citrobacter freundii]HAT2236492.1 DUF2591 domain-containing protein [Citrobacter freundii]
MDYSKMSDFEINCLVAEATGHSPLDAEHGYAGLQAEGDITAAIVRGPRKIGAFDPCNNPADAWPIILSKLISVEPDYEFIDPSEEQVFASGAWIAEHFDGKGEHLQYVDINPLRAAMIVFLQMQDSANVPANSTGSDIR